MLTIERIQALYRGYLARKQFTLKLLEKYPDRKREYYAEKVCLCIFHLTFLACQTLRKTVTTTEFGITSYRQLYRKA